MAISYTPELIDELNDLVMVGYRRYPWGGVEIGGILFGKKDADGVRILAHRPIDCEHDQGPSFELSSRDLDRLQRQLADDFPQGLVPIGWYHSVSRGDAGLTAHDLSVHGRFFPEPWQIAMVLRRGKTEPVAHGFFVRREDGSVAKVSAAPFSSTEIAEAPRAFSGPPKDPFSAVPDPEFFYPNPQHKEALAGLLYGIQARTGFLVLIGSAGTGKSLLLECLADKLKAQSVDYAFLFNPRITTQQLFESLAAGLNLNCSPPTKSNVLVALNDRLVQRAQQGKTTVLIVDNSEKLSPDVMEEILRLGDVENRKGKLLQVVFGAQPSFDRQMETAQFWGLQKRILFRARLDPLSPNHTSDYIDTRLAKAGMSEHVTFPAALVTEIHARTGGNPRLINAVCAHLLRCCTDQQRETPGTDMLDEALSA